jgi:hypothetical protein
MPLKQNASVLNRQSVFSRETDLRGHERRLRTILSVAAVKIEVMDHYRQRNISVLLQDYAAVSQQSILWLIQNGDAKERIINVAGKCLFDCRGNLPELYLFARGTRQ